ncbi:hypothetical protein JCM10213_000424 [Rhodosporidiobolus nylandii]
MPLHYTPVVRHLGASDRAFVEGLSAHFERHHPRLGFLASVLWNRGYRTVRGLVRLAWGTRARRTAVLEAVLGFLKPRGFDSVDDLSLWVFGALGDVEGLKRVERAAYTRPAPRVVEGQREYEVDAVVGVKKTGGGRLLYRVAWHGYGPSERTWEDRAGLSNTLALRNWQSGKRAAYISRSVFLS